MMMTYTIFSARQHYALRDIMISPVRLACPSFCPSVTRVDQSKAVKVRIMQLSSQSSPMTPVSSRLTSPRNSKGNTGSGDDELERGRKMGNFQPISRRISETVQDRTKVTTSCICGFDWHQGQWPWTTLNCYRPKFKFSRNFALLRIVGRHERLNEWR